MSEPLKVLILEHNLADAELLIYELQEAGFEPDWQRVETKADYTAVLQQVLKSESRLDVILADYTLPQFDAVRALKELRKRKLEIPFIVVTGSVDEAVVVTCIKQGAVDYLLKDRLARLGPAVRQALAEQRLRQEQRQAQAALQVSEERLHQVITSISDHIYMTEITETGHYQNHYLSPNIEVLTGYPLEKFIADQTFWATQVIHPDDRAEAALQAGRLAQGQASEIEYRLVRADGELVWVRDSARIRQQGRSKFIYGVVSDITARKRLEEQFYQAQKMEALGRLVGGIAHDFNNILTIIVSLSALMLQHLHADDPLWPDVEQIKTSGERAATLTRQLLAFSRKQVLRPKILDLNEMLTNIETMLRRLIGEDIDLEIKPTPDLGRVKADPGQIDQVIMNLVVNARDAMPRGGKLILETANVDLDDAYALQHVNIRPGAYVLLTISDTGHGMDAATQSRIFDPFFTTKEQGQGTGLGLATVHGIVNQSGGHIWVYSEPGQGTMFKIYLPRVDEPPQPIDRTKPSVETLEGSETILLVDDDEAVRELAQRILYAYGYTVLTACQGQEALQIFEQHPAPIHLLISDVIMPGDLDGRALVEKLTPLRPDLKVLFMSGYTHHSIFHHGRLPPHIAFLEKPFGPIRLARRVREILDTDLG